MSDLTTDTDTGSEPVDEFDGLALDDDALRAFVSEFDPSLGATPDTEGDDEDDAPAAEAEPAPEPEPAVEAPSALDTVLAELGLDPDDAANVLRYATRAAHDPVQPPPPATPAVPPTYGGQTAASGYGNPASVPATEAGVNDPTATPVGQAGAPQRPDLSILEELIPGLSDYFGNLEAQQRAAQERFALFEAQQQELARAEAERQQATAAKAIEVGVGQFRDRYPTLDDQQFQRVLDRAAALQVMPRLVAEHGGDHVAATVAALDLAAWHDEQTRASLMQAQLDAFASQQVETRERKGKAASLSPTSGSVPRTATAAAPADMTPDQRRKALEAEIATALRVGG